MGHRRRGSSASRPQIGHRTVYNWPWPLQATHKSQSKDHIAIFNSGEGSKSITELHLSSDLEDLIVLGCCNKIDMKTTSNKSFDGVLLTLIKTEREPSQLKTHKCYHVPTPVRRGTTFTIILQGRNLLDRRHLYRVSNTNGLPNCT